MEILISFVVDDALEWMCVVVLCGVEFSEVGHCALKFSACEISYQYLLRDER